MIIHVVKPSETLFFIANMYGVSPWSISSRNKLVSETLVPGQTLVILKPELLVAVSPGDTLYSIAQQNDLNVNALIRMNPWLTRTTTLVPGQQLAISYGSSLRPLTAIGYAYPHADMRLLFETLPYLSCMMPFTYGFNTDGTLVYLDDEALLDAARINDIQAFMHLSTLNREGNFDSSLSVALFQSPAMQRALLDNVVGNILDKGYDGLDIDFEYVPGPFAASYAAFVRAARERLAPYGKRVIAALAPKISSEQRGLLYEGYSYADLGAVSDAVLLMTYEWGYTYSSPMAVAPIDKVRQVVLYALTQIPAKKILLGIPNYGYDWPLPFVEGRTRAQSISNERAVELARIHGVSIQYDEKAQSPHFQYTDTDGSRHEVWFEDARSIRAKLDLIDEFSLLGVGYWNLMRPFAQNWLVLGSLYDIVSLS